MYQKDVLREYISKSELRVFSEKIKVRLSKELAKNMMMVVIIII